MDKLKKQIEKHINNQEIDEAVKTLINQEEFITNSGELEWRAELFISLQRYSLALNDYIKLFKQEPENKIIISKIKMIKEILKSLSNDIYAATNTNNDPWLDI